MKCLFIFTIYLVQLNLCNFWSQNIQFEEIIPQSPTPSNLVDFAYTSLGETKFADTDGDGDLDAIITGASNSFTTATSSVCYLYINDGSGNFTLYPNTPFDGVWHSTVDFSDIDNDNDLDILITGQNILSNRISKIYLNNGNNNFTLLSGTPFEGVELGSSEFADVDNDGDQDLFFSGITNSNNIISRLYINDGNLNFTLSSGANFEGVYYSSSEFLDIDNDLDLDIIISGLSISGETSKLYINDGNGNFTENFLTNFIDVNVSSITTADIDNDSDLDIVIGGRDAALQRVTKLYSNDGTGSFTEVLNTPFDGVWWGDIHFFDANADNYPDLIISGQNNSNDQITKLYLNDGLGTFTEDLNSVLYGGANSSIAIGDVDLDNDLDFVMNYQDNNLNYTKLYINDGFGIFSWASRVFGDGVEFSSSVFGDIDGDGDQDIIISGAVNPTANEGVVKLYKNDGSGNFTKGIETPIIGTEYGSILLTDIENDNDLDLLITGWGGPFVGEVTKLYTNDGLGNFSEVLNSPFDPIEFSATLSLDVDNDNDEDIIICGRTPSNQSITKLFINDGIGNFSQSSNSVFTGVYSAAIASADIDQDNDLDILISGYEGASQYSTRLYQNEGNGIFSEMIGTPFVGMNNGDAEFCDIDGDNDPDLLITGDSLGINNTRLYTNDGNGSFTEVTNTPFDQNKYSRCAFFDVDSDNDFDLLISGYNGNENSTKLYSNNGTGFFTLVPDLPFDQVSNGSISISDIDGDTDQDVFITGFGKSNGVRIAKIYRNNTSPLIVSENTEQNISIFPNPTNQSLTIELQFFDKIKNIGIYDAFGKQVFFKTINSEEKKQQINISHLKKGVYFVRLILNDEIYSKKIIKL